MALSYDADRGTELSVVVGTAEGLVRGKRSKRFLSWRGIPYAAPPVGGLRFRAPQPVVPWRGVRDATRWGDAAPQPRFGRMLGPGKYQPMSEDCLTVNVLAPAKPCSRPRPVMVFIHGGGYYIGTSALSIYGGQKLVERGDIVYVSMNYRLGALGYLDLTEFATPDRPIESNLGLRDQIAALEWVRRNIAAFGGDPENVTVFGQSAGGNAVTSLVASPAARGLFARAIAQSPDAGVVYSRERSADLGRRFVTLLGADRVGGSVADALTAATDKEIGRATMGVLKDAAERTPGVLAIAPVVDGEILPQSPIDAFADGSALPVPLMIGTTKREGALFTRFMSGGLPLTEDTISRMFEETDPDAAERVTAAYAGYPGATATVDLGGDAIFWMPVVTCAEGHSRYAPTYCYRYDFSTRLLDVIGFGATHAMDLFPVFGLADTPIGAGFTILGGRRAFGQLSRRMQRHWLSFARSGRPLPAWPAFDEDRRRTMVFDAVDHVEDDPLHERRLAWQGYRGYV